MVGRWRSAGREQCPKSPIFAIPLCSLAKLAMSKARRMLPSAPMIQTIANNLRAIRTDIFGASMTDFAKTAGVSVSTVSRWEDASAVPNLLNLHKLRAAAILAGLDWSDSAPFVLYQPEGKPK